MQDLIRAIDAAADPGTAAALARYFKTGPAEYGEGDIFVGVKLSTLRLIVHPYAAEPFEPAQWIDLLCSPIHEHRMAALVVMSDRAERALRPRLAAPSELAELYRTYLEHTAYVNNWDLVDVSCRPIVGGYLLDRDRGPLYDLARSDLLWERRIAIVSCQRFLRAGKSAELYRIAELLLSDPQDLMHKAVGWSLREAGRQVGADELRRFLDQHAATMPRTALRYAIEHFDQQERQRYLALGRHRRALGRHRPS